MTREELIAYDKWLTRRKWGTGEIISPEKAADLYLAEHPLPPAEGAEAILHRHIDKQSMDELSVNVWPDMLEAMHEFAAQQQPTAEGAEDFLKKYTIYCKNVISIEGKTWVLSTVIPQAMQEFATLHAQRIADKMVEKNWININDRMPESGFCVLLYSESGGVAEGAWSDSNGYFEQWRWSAILSDVTHWMPLPNPPIR